MTGVAGDAKARQFGCRAAVRVRADGAVAAPAPRLLERRIGGCAAEIEIALVAIVVWVLLDLGKVVSFERFGEFVEELNKFGGSLAAQPGGQTDEREIVRLQPGRQEALRALAGRALALRAVRSCASLSR